MNIHLSNCWLIECIPLVKCQTKLRADMDTQNATTYLRYVSITLISLDILHLVEMEATFKNAESLHVAQNLSVTSLIALNGFMFAMEDGNVLQEMMNHMRTFAIKRSIVKICSNAKTQLIIVYLWWIFVIPLFNAHFVMMKSCVIWRLWNVPRNANVCTFSYTVKMQPWNTSPRSILSQEL